MKVVHDREQPCPQVAANAPHAALLPCTCQRVLYEIVGPIDIAGERARVAPEPWQGGDEIGMRQRIWQHGRDAGKTPNSLLL